MFSKLKYDFPASIVVFLVALPLCLGIALASGAPMISGVIAGIVGGLVVGSISESQTSVSGPAAGLAAIVLSAISSLGSFEVFLSATLIAGAFQLILGFTRSGFIADYIPTNVIKGLLAAIGILLILKQIPHAFGLDKDPEGEFSFFQLDGENTFSELFQIGDYLQVGALIVAIVSFIILTQWKKTPLAKYSFLPASLIVVVVGIIINAIFKAYFPSLAIGSSHLVFIPEIHSVDDIITTPDFSQITTSGLWLTAFTIAAVASLETLLNLEAVENIDPHKRVASPNRELVAQGFGNMVCGMVGGLPVTSVIVRSSVNIQSGARTKMSAILHSVLLLVSILFGRDLITQIPLSALAAILIMVGYKLANVEVFKSMYAKGLNQFIPFVVTILAIVFTDLLIGILIGLAVSIFYLLKTNLKNPFTKEVQDLHVGETIRLTLSDQVSFLNKASIKNTLWNIEEGGKVVIDARDSDYIHQDVLELIADFKNTVAVEKNIQANIMGIKDHYELEDHIDFVQFLDKDAIEAMNPYQILEILKKGNQRFVNGQNGKKEHHHKIDLLSKEENPFAVVISCIDARISPDIIFDTELGDLVSIRIAGNVISDEALGSMEMACQSLGIKLIIVLGHSNCDSVKFAIEGAASGHFSSVTDKIKRAIPAGEATNDPSPDLVNSVCKSNVEQGREDIVSQSAVLKSLDNEDKLSIVCAFYDIQTGEVDFKD